MSQRSTKDEFVKKANAVHNNKYVYDNVLYLGSPIKVTIQCSIHGQFMQSPNSHLQGHGCPKCANEAKIGWDAAWRKGANCNFWKGGTTGLNEHIRKTQKYKHWRKAIYERDNYTCCTCRLRGGELAVDHIKPVHMIIRENNITTVDQARKCEALWDKSNGRTMCRTCHLKTDTFGNKMTTKRPITQYDLDLNPISDWDSVTKASIALGIPKSGIKKCVVGKRKTSAGFIWKYKIS